MAQCTRTKQRHWSLEDEQKAQAVQEQEREMRQFFARQRQRQQLVAEEVKATLEREEKEAREREVKAAKEEEARVAREQEKAVREEEARVAREQEKAVREEEARVVREEEARVAVEQELARQEQKKVAREQEAAREQQVKAAREQQVKAAREQRVKAARAQQVRAAQAQAQEVIVAENLKLAERFLETALERPDADVLLIGRRSEEVLSVVVNTTFIIQHNLVCFRINGQATGGESEFREQVRQLASQVKVLGSTNYYVALESCSRSQIVFAYESGIIAKLRWGTNHARVVVTLTSEEEVEDLPFFTSWIYIVSVLYDDEEDIYQEAAHSSRSSDATEVVGGSYSQYNTMASPAVIIVEQPSSPGAERPAARGSEVKFVSDSRPNWCTIHYSARSVDQPDRATLHTSPLYKAQVPVRTTDDKKLPPCLMEGMKGTQEKTKSKKKKHHEEEGAMCVLRWIQECFCLCTTQCAECCM